MRENCSWFSLAPSTGRGDGGALWSEYINTYVYICVYYVYIIYSVYNVYIIYSIYKYTVYM